MSKASAITIAIIASVFVGFLVILGINKTTDTTDYSIYDTAHPIAADDNNGQIADRVRGNRDAKFFLVEYADLSCAMCGEANPIIESYLEDKNGEVALIFRNYPVQASHPNAIAAASAAEAAGFIKKPASALEDEATKAKIATGFLDDTYYFEMLDLLFKNRTVWWAVDPSIRNDTFVDLFRRIAPEANVDEFLAHMGSDQVKAKINFDLGLGRYQGVTGTPSYFLDNQKLDIPNITAIDSVLKPAIEAKLKYTNNI